MATAHYKSHPTPMDSTHASSSLANGQPGRGQLGSRESNDPATTPPLHNGGDLGRAEPVNGAALIPSTTQAQGTASDEPDLLSPTAEWRTKLGVLIGKLLPMIEDIEFLLEHPSDRDQDSPVKMLDQLVKLVELMTTVDKDYASAVKLHQEAKLRLELDIQPQSEFQTKLRDQIKSSRGKLAKMETIAVHLESTIKANKKADAEAQARIQDKMNELQTLDATQKSAEQGLADRLQSIEQRELVASEKIRKLDTRDQNLRHQASKQSQSATSLGQREAEIRARESVLTRRESEIADRENQLTQREAESVLQQEKRQSDLVARETQTAAEEADANSRHEKRESEIADREQNLANRETSLSLRHEKRQSEIADREQNLANRETSLSLRHEKCQSELASLERQVLKKEADAVARFEKRESDMAIREQLLASKEVDAVSRYEKRDLALANREQLLASKEVDAVSRHEKRDLALANKEETLNRTEAHVHSRQNKREEQLNKKSAELDVRDGHLRILRDEHASKHKQREREFDQWIANTSDSLQAVEQSLRENLQSIKRNFDETANVQPPVTQDLEGLTTAIQQHGIQFKQDHDSVCDSYNRTRAGLNDRVKELQSELDKAHAQIIESKADSSQEHEKLHADLTSALAKNQKLEDSLAHSEAALETMNAKDNDRESTLVSLHQLQGEHKIQNKHLEDEVVSVSTQLRVSQVESDSLRAELSTTKDSLLEQSNLLQNSESKHAALKEENAKLTTEMASLQKHQGALGKEISQKTSELSNNQQRLEDLQCILQSARSECESTKLNLAGSSNELQTMKSLLETQRQQTSELLEAQGQFKGEIAIYKNNAAEHKQAMSTEQTKCSKLQEDIQTLRLDLGDAEMKLEALQEEKASCDAERDNLRRELNEANISHAHEQGKVAILTRQAELSREDSRRAVDEANKTRRPREVSPTNIATANATQARSKRRLTSPPDLSLDTRHQRHSVSARDVEDDMSHDFDGRPKKRARFGQHAPLLRRRQNMLSSQTMTSGQSSQHWLEIPPRRVAGDLASRHASVDEAPKDDEDEMISSPTNSQSSQPVTAVQTGRTSGDSREEQQDDPRSEPASSELVPNANRPRSAIMEIAHVRDPNLNLHPLPQSICDRIRERVVEWDKCKRPVWTKASKHQNCVEMRVWRKRSLWNRGEDVKCDTCVRNNHLCIVVRDEGKMEMLRKPEVEKDCRPSDSAYWL